MGFPALYVTGYGAAASMLMACPMPASPPTPTWWAGRRTICSMIETPLIADADTGYGGLLNVHRTVRGYEAAGRRHQIEDQEMPKECGHTPGRRVVAGRGHGLLKIKVAAEARRDPATRYHRRPHRCALPRTGSAEALRRARKLYEQAGADVDLRQIACRAGRPGSNASAARSRSPCLCQ